MSQENTRHYKRDQRSMNPFSKPSQFHKSQRIDQGRPGSDWGLSQIKWLGVKFEWDCDFDQLLSQASEFQPNFRLQRSIIDALNMPWEDVINSKSLDRKSLYANLAKLARIKKSLDDYDKSSTIEGSSSQPASQDHHPLSPLSSPQQIQEPTTPIQHFRSSTVDASIIHLATTATASIHASES